MRVKTITHTSTLRLFGVATFAAVLIAASLIIAPKVDSQEANSISLNVSPTVIELDANPGGKQEGSFKIINGSDIALELVTTPKNFVASDEIGGVNLTEDDTSYSLADWISVSPETASVDARGSQIFNYTITVPQDAEPGGHFGSIIVQTEGVRIDETGPAVSQEVGPLILVRIAGDTFQEASIVEFATTDRFQEKGPVTFQTRIENTGNVHFKPRGTITIKNMFGKTVTTIDLEEKNVLPDSIRKLTNDWNPTGISIGRYTADLTLVYGVDDKIVTASTSYVLFPYKTVLPLVVALVVIVFIAIRHRKRIQKAITVLRNG